MSAVPLHIQRRIERRWAARLNPQGARIPLENVNLKRTAPSRRTCKPKKSPPA
jgi:hypothetical protein